MLHLAWPPMSYTSVNTMSWSFSLTFFLFRLALVKMCLINSVCETCLFLLLVIQLVLLVQVSRVPAKLAPLPSTIQLQLSVKSYSSIFYPVSMLWPFFIRLRPRLVSSGFLFRPRLLRLMLSFRGRCWETFGPILFQNKRRRHKKQTWKRWSVLSFRRKNIWPTEPNKKNIWSTQFWSLSACTI